MKAIVEKVHQLLVNKDKLQILVVGVLLLLPIDSMPKTLFICRLQFFKKGTGINN